MDPWGVAMYGLGGRRKPLRIGSGEVVPLGGEPGGPIGAGIVDEVLGTPEDADPIGDGPLDASCFALLILTEAHPQVHLEPIGERDDPDQATDRLLAGEPGCRLPDAPAMMPVPEGF